MKIRPNVQKLKRFITSFSDFFNRFEDLQQAVARIEMRQLANLKLDSLQGYEFKAYSQNGEDGIIQFLINHVQICKNTFVEFGVHNYLESNTRFLLKQNNWSGLVIDGSQRNIDFIKSDPLYWQHNLKAECAFVNRDNINCLISSNGLRGDLGLLSIDIDGNDYWVWEAVDCVNPCIVICEYNSLFGPTAKVSVPYDENFIYNLAHYSTLYWGASIAAFHYLARKKGYSLVASNSSGNNIFFVRDDLLGDLPHLSPEQAHVKSSFRTSRDPQGNLTFLDAQDSFSIVADLPLRDVSTGQVVTLRDIT